MFCLPGSNRAGLPAIALPLLPEELDSSIGRGIMSDKMSRRGGPAGPGIAMKTTSGLEISQAASRYVGIAACMLILAVSAASFAVSAPDEDVPAAGEDKVQVRTVQTEFGGFDLAFSPDYLRVTGLSLRLDRFPCGGTTMTGSIHAENRGLWSIENNRFEVETNLGVFQIIISGAFDDSSTDLSGTWEIHSAGATCSGAWNSL